MEFLEFVKADEERKVTTLQGKRISTRCAGYILYQDPGTMSMDKLYLIRSKNKEKWDTWVKEDGSVFLPSKAALIAAEMKKAVKIINNAQKKQKNITDNEDRAAFKKFSFTKQTDTFTALYKTYPCHGYLLSSVTAEKIFLVPIWTCDNKVSRYVWMYPDGAVCNFPQGSYLDRKKMPEIKAMFKDVPDKVWPAAQSTDIPIFEKFVKEKGSFTVNALSIVHDYYGYILIQEFNTLIREKMYLVKVWTNDSKVYMYRWLFTNGAEYTADKNSSIFTEMRRVEELIGSGLPKEIPVDTPETKISFTNFVREEGFLDLAHVSRNDWPKYKSYGYIPIYGLEPEGWDPLYLLAKPRSDHGDSAYTWMFADNSTYTLEPGSALDLEMKKAEALISGQPVIKEETVYLDTVTGMNIAAALKDKGMTQETLAGALGISQAGVSRMVSGTSPSMGSLLRVADILMIPVHVLTDRNPVPYYKDVWLRVTDTVYVKYSVIGASPEDTPARQIFLGHKVLEEFLDTGKDETVTVRPIESDKVRSCFLHQLEPRSDGSYIVRPLP